MTAPPNCFSALLDALTFHERAVDLFDCNFTQLEHFSIIFAPSGVCLITEDLVWIFALARPLGHLNGRQLTRFRLLRKVHCLLGWIVGRLRRRSNWWGHWLSTRWRSCLLLRATNTSDTSISSSHGIPLPLNSLRFYLLRRWNVCRLSGWCVRCLKLLIGGSILVS